MEIAGWLKKHWLLLVILAALVGLRLAYLFFLHPPLIWIDASQYDELGWSLAQHGTYSMAGEPFAGREPGYPLFFLAPLYLIFGHSLLAVQIFQLILSLLIGGIIYWLGQRYFSKGVGLLAAAFFALYPPFVAYSSEILTEIPFTFLILTALVAVIFAWKKDSVWLFLLAGLLIGMATLTRFIAAFLPLAFGFGFFFVSRDWRKAFRLALLTLAVTAVMITPWLWRNYSFYHTFIFGRLGGGEIYWSGSYLPWDGEWKGLVAPVDELEKGLVPLEIDKKLSGLAIQNIKENPTGVFLMWLKKPFKIFLKSEFNAVLDRDNGFSRLLKRFAGCGPGLLKGLLFSLNLAIILLLVAGVRPALKKHYPIAVLFLAVLGYFILFYLPLNPDSRYKLPLLPYIFIFASLGLLSIKRKIKSLIHTHSAN